MAVPVPGLLLLRNRALTQNRSAGCAIQTETSYSADMCDCNLGS
jgi:hypothetical protein